MPRKKVKSKKLTGRISENYFPIEVVEFVEEKLKRIDQAELVRQAIEVLWKHETGQLYQEDIEDKLTKIIENANIKVVENKDKKETTIEEEFQEEVEDEIESQFDAEGNFDFNF